jgi:hypothetical protein
MNSLCTPLIIILQEFTIVTKLSSLLYSTNTRKYWKSSGIFHSNHGRGISCDSRQLYEANRTLHSSVTCISKKIHENKTDEWHTAWINPRVPSLGLYPDQDFHPVVYSFHQTYKADKIRSCYLSTGQALFTQKESGGHYLAREKRVDICLPTHNCHKMQPLDKASIWPLKTFYSQEIEIYLR